MAMWLRLMNWLLALLKFWTGFYLGLGVGAAFTALFVYVANNMTDEEFRRRGLKISGIH